MDLALFRSYFTINAILEGSLLFVAVLAYITQRRPPSKEEVLREKILDLKRVNRLRFGQNRHLQEVNQVLKSVLNRALDEKQQAQDSEARLSGDLAREKKRSRSLEFELQRERDKLRGTRKK